MKNKLIITYLFLLCNLALFAQTARVQIIHNSPSPTVDVYAGADLLLDNFAFRTASSFIDVPAGVPIPIGVAPSTSTSSADAIFTQTLTLESGKTYVVVASGIVGDPSFPFGLSINADGRESASVAGNVDVAVHHGSPGAPNVDVDAAFIGNVVADLAYGSFTGYLGLSPAKYDFVVRAAGTSTVVGSYRADLSGLGGGAATVFASGVLGSPDAAFGIFAALTNGTVIQLPLTPTARVQVIHNSPSPTVDVYAGATLLIDNFAFRTASPFIDVPADIPVNIGIAPEGSASAAEAIFNQTLVLETGKKYVVVASGIVGNAASPFNLAINADARESASVAGNVDVAVHHGSPGAPNVDVDAAFIGNVVADLAYGSFTGYLGLSPAKYDFVVRAAGTSTVVASYRADLSGLGGGAATVFASGILGSTDAAFGVFAALPNGTVIELPLTPTARVQVIHNSPSPTVDVYAGETLLIDNFAFRTASPFIDVPADIQVNIGIAPEGSASAAEAIFNQTLVLETGKKYVVVASGIVGNAAFPFNLAINANARESASVAGNVDVAVHHGSPGAPNVDVDAAFIGNVISNLAYGSFTGYLGLPAAKYDFIVRVAGTPAVVASYRADLSGLGGGAATVFASGVLGSPTAAFGVFAALPNGTVIQLPLTPTARVQVIHNSPSPTVDVYAGETLLIDNFAFRTASPFIDVPADAPVKIGIAPEGSASAAEAIFSQTLVLETGKKYVVVASGVVGNPLFPFNLAINNEAQEASAGGAGNVDIAVHHGSPGAPNVDVDEVFTGNVISNLSYGNFTGYLGLPAGKYDFAVRAAGTPAVVASYRADLSGLGGGAATVFASGILGNAQTPFGIFAALPDGTVLELPLTPTARVQVIHNSPEPTVDVYAGAVRLIDNFVFRTATPFISVPADREFAIGVAGENSSSAADAIASFPVNLATGGTYTVIAGGIVGNAQTPFTLYAFDNALEAGTAGNVAVSVFHGSPDAPAVDVAERLAGSLIENLAFGEKTDYLSLPAASYVLDVRAAGTAPIVASFQADLSGLGGGAATVFASGLLGGTPGFGLFAALPNGTVVELPAVQLARLQVIHNSPSPTVDVYANGAKLIDDFEFRKATPFIYVPAGQELSIAVAPGNSQSVNDAIATFPVTFDNGATYTAMAHGVVGNATTPFTLSLNTTARERAEDANLVDLNVFHGATDAPSVDITLPNGIVLIDNLDYGTFTDYLSVPGAAYVLNVTPANDNNTIVASYLADVTGLGGAALTAFATGYLSPASGQPAFGVWVALADGTTFPLSTVVSTNTLGNLEQITLAPNPATTSLNVNLSTLENTAVRFQVFDLTGRLVTEGDWGNIDGAFGARIDVSTQTPGMYLLKLTDNEGGQYTTKFVKQ